MAIINKAQLTSNANHNGETIAITTQSNNATTYLAQGDVKVEKTVSRSWTIAGDSLTVTTVITNNLDVDIEDLTILDTITAGATFVEGSVKIGNQTYPDFDPFVGAKLPITLGGSGMDMTITYDITINDDVAVRTISLEGGATFEISGASYTSQSNKIDIQVLNNEIYINKQADKQIVKSGDTLTYTLTISNNGELTNTDLVLTDPIPAGTGFVEDSLTINGTPKLGTNPASGINLDDLPANETITITFQVQVD